VKKKIVEKMEVIHIGSLIKEGINTLSSYIEEHHLCSSHVEA